MRPRIHIPLSPADHAAVSAWSRRMIVVCALIAAAMVGHSMIYQHADATTQGAKMNEPTLAPSCMQWHQAASEVVARLAQSTRDSDLRQANDAIFRMRRARRNCEEGWFALACQDYYSIARNMGGYPAIHEVSLLACRRSAVRSE